MEIKTKYNIGDQVYVISDGIHSATIKDITVKINVKSQILIYYGYDINILDDSQNYFSQNANEDHIKRSKEEILQYIRDNI
jgi:hypothetical protein